MLTRIKTDGDINRYCGLSTDTKPTDGVPNMSEFSEIDTSKKYVFDEENGQWVEDTGSGGGGGGGASGAMVVHITYSYDEEADTDIITADKTPSDVLEEMKKNCVVGILDDIYAGMVIPIGCATTLVVGEDSFPMFLHYLYDVNIKVLHIVGDTTDNEWAIWD